MTTKADELVDATADKLESFVARSRDAGGVQGKLADALADDPAFLRKLKPSLMAARGRRTAPPVESPRAPSGPQLERPRRTRRGGGPSPWLLIGGALAVGVLTARAIAWRAHAHPRG
jgi:hypothetical protein